MYTWIRSESGFWLVGHYSLRGEWTTESVWYTEDEAYDRVLYMNEAK